MKQDGLDEFNDNDNSDPILKMRTINEIGRHQISFVKFKTALKNFITIMKTKEALIIMRSFRKFRENAQIPNTSIIRKVKSTLAQLLHIYERHAELACRNSFKKFKIMTEVVWQLDQNIKSVQSTYKKDLRTKNEGVTLMKIRINEKVDEISKLKQIETNLKYKIKQKNESIKSIKELLMKGKISTQSEEKVTELESKISLLKTENVSLKEQWNDAETKVRSFITDITNMIESQKVLSTLFKHIEKTPMTARCKTDRKTTLTQ